jgi:iron(III) transport system ATP-binding protein
VNGEAMVRLRGVSRSYGPVEAVRSLNLDVKRGEILTLLGPSGCGKTTTLRLIAGFEPPDSGTVEVGGRTVAGPGILVAPENRRVGMVFQDYALFPHLSVARNVAYGLPRNKRSETRISEVLELTHLSGLGERMPHELSGGQQQRVALARALAPEPDIVLLDEPFSNLDASLRARVRSEMREILNRAGATAVFVTHDQEEALSLADEVAVMLGGTVVQSAPPEELYHHPATREVASFVGDANFLPGTAENGHVRCELGTIPTLGSGEGEVEIMLRPEALVLRALPNGQATVEDREFYGHDQLLKLRLDSGRTLRARLVGGPGFSLGERVAVSVWGPVVVFQSALTSQERRTAIE